MLTRITIKIINYNNTIIITYSKQIISISLQTSSFDNVSHNAKPSRISHNSIISWQYPILHDFCLFLIELYQLGGWYLNANHGEIDYIYLHDK